MLRNNTITDNGYGDDIKQTIPELGYKIESASSVCFLITIIGELLQYMLYYAV